MCSPFSFSMATPISTQNIFIFWPSWNLTALQWQQLYAIYPAMGSFLSCHSVYNPKYSSSNSSCSKMHNNVTIRQYGVFGPSFVSMTLFCFSWGLHSGYETLSWLGDIWALFGTNQMTIMKDEFHYNGRFSLTIIHTCSPKSVTTHLWPRLPSFSDTQTSLPHFIKNTSIDSGWIHSVILKVLVGSQHLNVNTKSATAVNQCSGQSRSSFPQFWPHIMPQCMLSSNPVTHTLFNYVNILSLGCPVHFTNCFK